MGTHWYYAIGNQVIGPVGQPELKWLIDQGAIDPIHPGPTGRGWKMGRGARD